MLTRRGFAGFASCALCAVTGFMATDAAAQGSTPPAATPGVTRKILSQTDGPTPGYVTIIVEAQIEAGVRPNKPVRSPDVDDPDPTGR